MKYTTLLIVFISTLLSAQKSKSTDLGLTTKQELKMESYDLDKKAEAVVLYEHANIYLDEKNNFDFRTDYYFRIKIFDKNAFDYANISIPLYKDVSIKNIMAITYNLEGDIVKKTYLLKDDIFINKIDDYWSEARFTLPNLKEGSVIEYKYSTISPYSGINDWKFQSYIPKVKSDFDAALLANYKYKARLYGYKKLDRKNSYIKNECINIPGLNGGDCIVYSYGMENVPAFEKEDYMLSEKNYMSRLVLDLISYTDVNGGVKKYAKTWKDADRSVKNLYLDNQVSKERFFRKKIPSEILEITDELARAKSVYRFVQDNISWNQKYWTREKLNIKDSFTEGYGSVDAINLILYNCLSAADIESYIVASSTRSNGIPTKVYPITKDFNYILVKAVIDNKTYFLDATNKMLSFGLIPFHTLNGDGRVLDFKNESYWEPISTSASSMVSVRSELNLEEDASMLHGSMVISKSGYNALSLREETDNKSEDDYLDLFESRHPNITVNEYSVENLEDFEKSIKQNFTLDIDLDGASDTKRINPFIYGRTFQNPFKLKDRQFEVDFGYPRTFWYALKINIPENYEITKVPEDKSFVLPKGGGNYLFKTTVKDNELVVYSKFYLLKRTFYSDEYKTLQAFYNDIIKTEESTIELKKIL